jgi:hypothetical protein
VKEGTSVPTQDQVREDRRRKLAQERRVPPGQISDNDIAIAVAAGVFGTDDNGGRNVADTGSSNTGDNSGGFTSSGSDSSSSSSPSGGDTGSYGG